ncbi:MAG: hypothetical protein K8T90_08055 [Planctomycetes bacterium]|nr:hypothetical protein [Planctomycetota bacterium]
MSERVIITGGVDVGAGACKAAIVRRPVGGEPVLLGKAMERIRRRDPKAGSRGANVTHGARGVRRSGSRVAPWYPTTALPPAVTSSGACS